MIIELLMQVLYRVLDILLFFNIPPLPEQVQGYVDMFFGYISTGASVLDNYVPLSYLLTLLGIIVAIDIGINVYHFVMWIIRKIPMLGMS